MLIFAKKLTKKGLSLIILALGAALCLIIIAVSGLGDGNGKYGKAETEEDRLAFIRSYGWEVKDTAGDAAEISIPREFDDVYNRYNLIQKAQGLDLKDFAGCRVIRYTYHITNYPTGEEGVLINLLVYDNKVIGGDVMSARLDGFMHGFRYMG